MKLEQVLSSLAPKRWEVAQAIILDWHDGPLAGLCELAEPSCCFYFEAIAYQYVEDNLDDRLFRWRILPSDSVERAISILADLGGPTKTFWVPSWQFASDSLRLDTEAKIDDLLSLQGDKGVIVETCDMRHFQRFWIEA